MSSPRLRSLAPPLTGAACAKFILAGEHSVVNRGRALALPLSHLRLELKLWRSAELLARETGLWLGETARSTQEFELVSRAVELLTKKLELPSLPVRLEIDSRIPIGGGLGSSAALSCALARALAPQASPERIAEYAMLAESCFHARPSGVDPYTIALEKPLLFRSTDKSWRELDLARLSAEKLCFGLYPSGKDHSTSQVQQIVSELREKTPLIWEDLMDALSTNAELMLQALGRPNAGAELGRIMNDSQSRLVQLGVSTPEIDTLIKRLTAGGALGAKLTGAGCGGYVLALMPQDSALAQTTAEGFLWQPPRWA